ncbi:MAG: hypothetical protein IKY83_06350 [Proteobacteria bacterium]|nr:hypothetical protein [Pseudomonadota bacterium]
MRRIFGLVSVVAACAFMVSCSEGEQGNENQTPGTQQPGTQQPGTQEPGTQEPGTQEPGTQEPGTQQSVGAIVDCKVHYVKDSLNAGENFEAYSTVKVAGVTGQGGTHTGLKGQMGYVVGDPSKTLQDVVWTDAQYNDQYGGDQVAEYDEYMSTNVSASASGLFAVFYRFSSDGGSTWTYCDGAGIATSVVIANVKLVNVSGGQTQDPGQPQAGGNIEWCQVTWPTKTYVEEQNSFDKNNPIQVYSQVYAPGITGANGSHAGITAQFGYVFPDENAKLEDITWVDAKYNEGFNRENAENNDEYMIASDLKLPEGYYVVFYKYSVAGGNTVLCDGAGMLATADQFDKSNIVSIHVK